MEFPGRNLIIMKAEIGANACEIFVKCFPTESHICSAVYNTKCLAIVLTSTYILFLTFWEVSTISQDAY